MTLGRNHIVTTGTCVVPLEIAPGDSVCVDFGPLGQVAMQFARAREE
jgi:2-keto-4-pentenoate hydratase